MLQKIRDQTQGWIMWVIVISLCAVFALWGISYYIDSNGTRVSFAASVDGTNIPEATLQNAYQRVRGQYSGANINAKKLREQILQTLINQQITLNAAKSAGLMIGLNQTDALISTLPEFQDKGKFSTIKYHAILRQANLTTDMLRTQIANSVITNQLGFGLLESGFALPNAEKEFAMLKNQKRKVTYADIAFAKFLKHSEPSNSAIESYYHSHKHLFSVPEKVTVAYVELSTDNIAKKIKINDNQVKTYYQTHLNEFLIPGQRRVSQILIEVAKSANKAEQAKAQLEAIKIEHQLKSGQSFATLAKKHSNDQISAKKGGDIGWISRADSSFAKAAFALKKVGDYSAPIKTNFGWQIVKVSAIKPSKQQSFTQVSSQIKTRLQQQKAERLYARDGNDLANLAFENPDSLDFAAQKLGLKIHLSEPFSRQVGSGIAANKAVIDAAFSPNVLQGNNSGAINLSNSEVVILRLKKHFPPTMEPLAKVKQKIVTNINQEAAKSQARAKALKLVSALKKGDKTNSLAQQYGLNWHEKTVSRLNKGINSDAVAAIFSQSTPSKDKVVANYVTLPQKLLVFKILQVIPGSTRTDSNNQAELSSMVSTLDYQQYQSSLRHRAIIKINKVGT